jgi:phosphoribosylaminoimidazole carboxylase PurE protein
MAEKHPRVLILMGSDSDYEVMKGTAKVLAEFDIPFEMTVSSAHRSPERTEKIAKEAAGRGVQVIVAGAGHAAHLAGVLAATTPLPVLGVPIPSSDLSGLDSLLATVQMPGGVPVGTLGIGSAGAKNAGMFAVRMLALGDADLAQRLADKLKSMASGVEDAANRLSERLKTDFPPAL